MCLFHSLLIVIFLFGLRKSAPDIMTNIGTAHRTSPSYTRRVSLNTPPNFLRCSMEKYDCIGRHYSEDIKMNLSLHFSFHAFIRSHVNPFFTYFTQFCGLHKFVTSIQLLWQSQKLFKSHISALFLFLCFILSSKLRKKNFN